MAYLFRLLALRLDCICQQISARFGSGSATSLNDLLHRSADLGSLLQKPFDRPISQIRETQLRSLMRAIADAGDLRRRKTLLSVKVLLTHPTLSFEGLL